MTPKEVWKKLATIKGFEVRKNGTIRKDGHTCPVVAVGGGKGCAVWMMNRELGLPDRFIRSVVVAADYIQKTPTRKKLLAVLKLA